MKSQVFLIITTLSTTIAAMLFLAYAENMQRVKNEDFWSISFLQPFEKSASFSIDNRSSEEKNYHYEITKDKKIILSDSISVPAHAKKDITIDQKIPIPFEIFVHHKKQKQSIQLK